LISNDNDNYIIYDIKEGIILEKLQEKSAYTQRFVDDLNVYVALMNGVILSLRQSNFKKNCVKTVHYNSIMKL